MELDTKQRKTTMSYHPYGYRPSYYCEHCGHAHSTSYCPRTGVKLKAIGEGPAMWLVEGFAFSIIHLAVSVAFLKPLSILLGLEWLYNVWFGAGFVIIALLIVVATLGSLSERADENKHKQDDWIDRLHDDAIARCRHTSSTEIVKK